MITNLLDKSVLFDGNIYKICAIYSHNGGLLFCLIDDEGKLLDGVRFHALKINEQKAYSVVMYWTFARKIHAIKTVREINGMGLREAKDLVESNPSCVLVKSKLTEAEAKEAMRKILANGMECRIEKCPIA